MPMKTVRVRRSRPSALALALALALTMLFVYAVTIAASEKEAQNASAQAHMQDEIHLDALAARFQVYAWAQDGYATRAEAANCYDSGGAGWILDEGGRYAVIFDSAQANDLPENAENIIERQAGGVTLELSGRADEVAALTDGARFLRAMAAETASLAASLENSGDASGVRAMMGVYKTRADKICMSLENAVHPAAKLVFEAVQRTSRRIDSAFSDMCPAKIRLVHVAANAEWVSLIEGLKEME